MFIVNIYWRLPMRTSVVDLRRTMSETINRVAFEKEHIIWSANGKDVLALVPMDDLALLERLEEEADVKAARAALAEIERTGEKPIPWEQVKAKLAAKHSATKRVERMAYRIVIHSAPERRRIGCRVKLRPESSAISTPWLTIRDRRAARNSPPSRRRASAWVITGSSTRFTMTA